MIGLFTERKLRSGLGHKTRSRRSFLRSESVSDFMQPKTYYPVKCVTFRAYPREEARLYLVDLCLNLAALGILLHLDRCVTFRRTFPHDKARLYGCCAEVQTKA